MASFGISIFIIPQCTIPAKSFPFIFLFAVAFWWNCKMHHLHESCEDLKKQRKVGIPMEQQRMFKMSALELDILAKALDDT